MCSKSSGLRQAISELVQHCGEALRHGFEPRLESHALRLGRIGWMPAQCERRPALVLGESADSGRVVGCSESIVTSAAFPQTVKPWEDKKSALGDGLGEAINLIVIQDGTVCRCLRQCPKSATV
jgi:hypothetical protein